jgi:hypothetical protein
LFEHDLFRKPVSTFGDHALGSRVVQSLRGALLRLSRELQAMYLLSTVREERIDQRAICYAEGGTHV